MLTVDLLHEVELGVVKALILHLVRMLHACGADKIHEFDERYQSPDVKSNHLLTSKQVSNGSRIR